METGSRFETVTVDAQTVWDTVRLYAGKAQALEALAQLLIDTPIGDAVAAAWDEAKQGGAQ